MENIEAKILVVEDDDSIRKFISINLKRNNFEVYEAPNGEYALDNIKSISPQVVILDIMLPGINGYDVCVKIREKYPKILIVMLTAKNQDMDKIMGLELGADDYIVKPFNPLELVARIRAMLRRSQQGHSVIPGNNVLASDSLRIDIKAQRLFKNNKPIELTPREFALVKVFMENPDKAFSRDELLNMAWGEDFIGDYKTIDVHVRRLREKVEDDPSSPRFIHTVWGYGYRFQEVK
jgi:DNA-binding response OmpR family regulator